VLRSVPSGPNIRVCRAPARGTVFVSRLSTKKCFSQVGQPPGHAAKIRFMTAAISTIHIDRRLDERSNCLTGLARWLESARRALGLDALALADASGCLVAGAGSVQRCEEMAALAPLSCVALDARDEPLCATAVGPGWLCAPAGELPAEGWQAVRLGCLRILGWRDAG
jgi:hypothetical protein